MTLIVDWKNGLIEKIRHKGIVGNYWGFETSDRWSFVTLTERSRGVNIVRDEISINDANSQKRCLEVCCGEGQWELEMGTTILENVATMTATVLTLKDSNFQDFVLRFVFPKESFERGTIAGNTYEHDASEVYWQFPCPEVRLNGKHGSVLVKVSDYNCADRFDLHMYLRALKDVWVVHARFIPKTTGNDPWIRWINRYFYLSLSPRASKMVFKIPGIRRALRYRTERKGKNAIQLQASDIVSLKKGEALKLSASCHFEA